MKPQYSLKKLKPHVKLEILICVVTTNILLLNSKLTQCFLHYFGLILFYQYYSFYPSRDALVPLDDTMSKAVKQYTEIKHLSVIDEDFLPILSEEQNVLNYGLNITISGRYVVVIDYISNMHDPELFLIKVNLLDDEQPSGVVTIYPCIYTTVCRQPVVDKEQREKLFWLDSSKLNVIQIHGDEDASVAIKSVTAIPYNEWSLDYIQPSSVCVMNKGKCEKATFRTAPDSKKIELELDDNSHLISTQRPTDIYDNTTKLIILNKKNTTVSIKSKAQSPGRYNVIIKYYQPNHPKFDIKFKLETERQVYDGKLAVEHCPSNIGCRGVLKHDKNLPWFDIEDNFTLSLTNENHNKQVWVDFVLLIPTEQYSEELIIEEPYDQTKEFIKNCGQDHFNIPLNASDFCRKAVFSLTIDYNGEALSCGCDPTGSVTFECDPFGGQCQCRQNVIGRKCDACRTGFYGFPDCKPCNCPLTALCEKDTGECICPPQVTGEMCDMCMPLTFGFDHITGCEHCNCNPRGVNGSLQCDLNTGFCK